MTQAILVFNAGSSSIKFAAYEVDADKLTLICKGLLDRRSEDTEFAIKDPDGYLLSFGEELDKAAPKQY